VFNLTREVYDVSGGRSERYILNKLSLSDQDGYVPHICTTGHGRTRAHASANRLTATGSPTKITRATNPALSLEVTNPALSLEVRITVPPHALLLMRR
jgi:hypothetical protein